MNAKHTLSDALIGDLEADTGSVEGVVGKPQVVSVSASTEYLTPSSARPEWWNWAALPL